MISLRACNVRHKCVNLKKQLSGREGQFYLIKQTCYTFTHHSYYKLGPPSLSWGKLCCTWSSLLPDPDRHFDSGSASSSSHLHTHSCRDSPDRREEVSTGSFRPLWCWSRSWRRVGRRRWCCSRGERCHSQRCCLSRWSL